MYPTKPRIALLALALLLGHSAPALAFDLTGSWIGSWSCTEFAGGVKDKSSNGQSTLVITSIGNGTFFAVLDESYAYRGIEIPDALKPDKGELGIVHCGSNDDLATGPYSELGRLKVSTRGDKGTLSGTTLWSNASSHIATCKYSYKRVDVVDPGLSYTCP